MSLREDELAATCMGINPVRIKLMAFAIGAGLASLMGGLYAAYLNSSGEPGTYDFTVSILAVCIVIVGGIGSISGVLVGALVLVGFDSLVLVKLAQWLENRGLSSSANVISTPNNWKFMIFGLALVLMMRFRPEGLLPSSRVKAELHHEDDAPPARWRPRPEGARERARGSRPDRALRRPHRGQRVDFEVEPGQISSVIGPNGAGKTTVFNAITGIYEPTEGAILFQGRDLRVPFTARAVVGFALIGLLTALGVVLTVNLEPIWEAVVKANFVYQQPFPYGKAMRDLWAFLIGPADRPRTAAVPGWSAGGRRRRLRGVEPLAARARRHRRLGIARTFQNIRLFPDMTVLENVWSGWTPSSRRRFWHIVLRTPLFWRERRETRRRAHELLEFVGLDDKCNELARNLPYGDQRRLEIARALATEPKLLLLDEPAAGMNPAETVELMDLIRKIRDRGVTVLLIEHHMSVVMGISRPRSWCSTTATRSPRGPPEEIRRNPRVIEAYLGKEEVG